MEFSLVLSLLVYQRVSLTYFATLVPSKATGHYRSSPVAGHGGIAAQRRQGGGALGAEGRYVRAAQGAQGGRPGGIGYIRRTGTEIWEV